MAALDKFSNKADQLLSHGNSSVSKVEFQAGGVGVWISVTACLVMLVALLIAVPIATAAYLDMRADIRALRDTDNAIRAYINTGILKPKPERDDDA